MFGKAGSLFGVSPSPSSTGGFQFGNPTAGTTGLVGGGGTTEFQFGGSTTATNNPNTASGFSLGSAGTLFTSTTLSSATGTTPSLGAFGAAPSVVRPTLSFGQTAPTSSALGGTGLFGGLGTGVTQPSTGVFSFATPATNTLGAQTGVGFGGFGGLGTTAAPLNLGGFGGLATTTTPALGLGSSLGGVQMPPSSLGLGSFGMGMGTAPSVPSMSLGFLGATTTPALTSTTASAFGLGGIQSTTATVTGLGGIGVSTTPIGMSDGAKSDSKTLKEYPIPPEIAILTEDFKKYLKDQKSTREDISRVSSKSLFKVEEETASLKQLLSVISNGIQRNTASIRQLKQDTVQELKNVEVMQRTKDIPLALQYENMAPMEFFNQLIATFELKMKTYRQQIEVMEQHLSSATQTSAFTPHELMNTIRKLYETFVYLASELQTIHEALEKQKDRYVTYRRLVHGESTNVFESRSKGLTTVGNSFRTPVTLGPSPFANVQSSTAAIFASALERAQQPGGAPPTAGLSSSGLNTSLTMASGLGMSALQSGGFQSSSNIMAVKPLVLTGSSSAPVVSTSGYGGFGTGSYTSTPTPVFGVANKPFQLQKPPVGNKRGKR